MRAMTFDFRSRYRCCNVNIKKSPAKYQLVGDFLGGKTLLYYLCSGISKAIFDMMKKLLICAVVITAIGMASCNVTRTISTQSQYYQKGDTTCTIVTKTIETYDASRKL